MELGNYKIKVTTEAESKEARELFFELGYMVVNNIDCEKGYIVASKNAESPINFDYWHDVKNIITIQQLRDLVAQSKNEQCLISGADALRALADGKEVELQATGDMNWYNSTQWNVRELLCFKGRFRLKPRTITLNIEIPAPFEPKDGDTAYFLSTSNACGYSYTNDFKGYGFDSLIQFGAWRTEEEIKKVVAALRGALKNG